MEQWLRQRDRFSGRLTPTDDQSKPAASSDIFCHDSGQTFQPDVALHHLGAQQTASECDHLETGHWVPGGEAAP